MLAHSQSISFTPIVVFSPAFARTITKLYVVGGAGPDFYWNKQAMVLDLNIPWSSTAPAWTQLESGPTQYNFPAAFSYDEQTLYTFHITQSNSPLQYNVQSNKWQDSPVKFQNAAIDGIGAVTDPRTGLIYLAGGYREARNVPFLKFMDVYDPVTQSIGKYDLPDPSESFPIRRYYRNVWSKHRSSILYWGGSNQTALDPGVILNGVTEFLPDSMAWMPMTTQGTGPKLKTDHCMAANDDGTKLAIYGGNNTDGTYDGELWVLDLISSTWAQGLAGLPRAQAACAIAGDQFLIWGGRQNPNTVASSEMIIYDFKTSAYVKQYTPPAFYKDLKPPPPLTRTKAPWDTDIPTANRKSGVGAAVGGAVGGVVLLGAIAGFIIFRKRQSRIKERAGYRDNIRQSQHGESAGSNGRWGEVGGGDKISIEDSRESVDEDEVLERTLKAFEEEQQELDRQRQFLEQQHQQETNHASCLAEEKSEQTAYRDDDRAKIFPIPPIPRFSSPSMSTVASSGEKVGDRRTVQSIPGPFGRYYTGDDDDTDVGARRQSELTQDMIEPLYDPNPE
ncbi:hypothetical protein BGX24_006257 [Mortierella sp. AD032]|nr:hypothetical protein BGX24_006257 [Mortierella sp. AD032]